MTILFERGAIRITTERFEYGSSTYPFSLIQSVTFFRFPFEVGAFFLNAALLLVGIAAFFAFEIWSMIIGSILGLMGFVNVWGIIKRKYHLIITLHNGQEINIESGDREYLYDAYVALEKARGVT